MTPAEIIATELLGWKKMDSLPHRPNDRLYSDPNESRVLFIESESPVLASANWPDLTDWNTIRRMDDAIAGKGDDWQIAYAFYLAQEMEADCVGFRSRIVEQLQAGEMSNESANVTLGILIGTRATIPQRVAAALRVIEERGEQ